jgi:hypothetical protein
MLDSWAAKIRQVLNRLRRRSLAGPKQNDTCKRAAAIYRPDMFSPNRGNGRISWCCSQQQSRLRAIHGALCAIIMTSGIAAKFKRDDCRI